MHHESCHALVCFILRVPVSAIQVTDGMGGAVVHRKVDPWRTTLITLAPYVLSLTLMPLLLAIPWLTGWFRWSLLVLLGLGLIRHGRSLVPQVVGNWRTKGSDCYRAGWLLSLAVIGAAQIALVGWWLRAPHWWW